MSRPDCLAAVLVAAGEARRYGRAKQLETWEGQTLVRGAALAAEAVSDELIVVLGANAEAIEPELDDLAVTLLRCPDWSLGMGHSIATAFAYLAAMAEPPDGALLCLVDQPRIRDEQLHRLRQVWFEQPRSIVVSRFGEHQGPPVIFPADLYAELATLTGDEGARSIVRKYRDRVVQVDLPEAADDIDTPDDYKRASNRKAG